MAKAAFHELPDDYVRKQEEQTGLDTRVVLADNDDFWVLVNIISA